MAMNVSALLVDRADYRVSADGSDIGFKALGLGLARNVKCSQPLCKPCEDSQGLEVHEITTVAFEVICCQCFILRNKSAKPSCTYPPSEYEVQQNKLPQKP